MGKPTKAVFPRPAVKIRHPVVLAGQDKILPKKLKKKNAIKNIIQATKHRETRERSQVNFGIVSRVRDGKQT
jgi:hypothetical protein